MRLRSGALGLVLVLAGCPAPPPPPHPVPTTHVPPPVDAGTHERTVLASTVGCTRENVLLEPAPTSACVIATAADDAIVNILVRTSDGEGFVVSTFGAPGRVHLREVDSKVRVEVTAPIAFTGLLAHAPELLLRKRLDAPWGSLREGSALNGATATGTKLHARARVTSQLELGPVDIACSEARLMTTREHSRMAEGSPEESDREIAPKDGAMVLNGTDPVSLLPTPDASDGVRLFVLGGVHVQKLGVVGTRTNVRLRTKRGAEVHGWVPTTALDPEESGGYGEGISLCACGHVGIGSTKPLRVAAGAPVATHPRGAPWGTVVEPFSVTEPKEENGWVQLTHVDRLSSSECPGPLVHAWVEKKYVTP